MFAVSHNIQSLRTFRVMFVAAVAVNISHSNSVIQSFEGVFASGKDLCGIQQKGTDERIFSHNVEEIQTTQRGNATKGIRFADYIFPSFHNV